MASIKTEKATKFFSRHKRDVSHILLQKDVLPPLSCQDVVQVCGGPGTGKTELVYHFILRCILPESLTWQGQDLKGLNRKVILIDNDCHFNLFRLIQILEKRLEHLKHSSDISRADISAFIDTRLEMLEIIKCTNHDEFVSSLRYLEFLRSQKYVLMIDGIASFFWSSKMRNLYSQAKLMEHQSLITSIIGNLSKNGILVIVTKRKLALSSTYDCSKLDALWKKASMWVLDLTYNCHTEQGTNVTVHNVTANRRVECTISNSGVIFRQ